MIGELIALRAVFGQDEADHGKGRYPVDAAGLVHVPPEAVVFLTSKGGFALLKTGAGAVQPAAADASGLVRLHHDDAAGCSYGGREYRVDEKGDVLVPARAAAELIAHGFVAVPEKGSRCWPGAGGKPAGAGKPVVAAAAASAAKR